jgi:hypothetical protein
MGTFNKVFLSLAKPMAWKSNGAPQAEQIFLRNVVVLFPPSRPIGDDTD